MKIKPLFMCMIATVLAAAGSVPADVRLPPSWVGPYRIIFVTSGTYKANETGIGWYNDTVAAAADTSQLLKDLGLEWRCVGSTKDVHAIDNIGSTWASADLPIYNTHGQKVGNNLNDIFDGSLINPVRYDQNGVEVGSSYDQPWTGTKADGTKSGAPLGATGTAGLRTHGNAKSTEHWWMEAGLLPSTASGQPLYGISPEPATVCLLGFGGLALRRRSRRRLHS